MSERDEQAVAEIVMFGDVKECSWRGGQIPPNGTKLYPESVIAALRAEVEELESNHASLCDTVAAALRNSSRSDAGIKLGCDLREHVWQISYAEVEQRQRATAAEAALAAHKASAGLALDMQHEPADFDEAKEMLRRAVAALRPAEDGLPDTIQGLQALAARVNAALANRVLGDPRVGVTLPVDAAGRQA